MILLLLDRRMKPNVSVLLALMASLLSGCSSQILEEVGDISVPLDCRDTTKLFSTFNMRATHVAWSSSNDAKEKTSIVTIELSLDNATKWPTPLSNSGNGVLYSVEYFLNGERSGHYAPKETAGAFKDIHTPIPLDKTVNGKLVFAVPRGSYILTVERKFDGTPVPGKREDHVSSCRISPTDSTPARPSNSRAISGVN
jgi:hypothetical protein